MVSGLLAFMAVTGYAGMLNLKGLMPEVVAPVEIFAGTPAPFRLRLHNRKKYIPSFLIRIECGDGEGTTLPLVPRASLTESPVQLTFSRRGSARIGTVKVSSPFPVNFFTRYWIFTLDDQVVIFPRLIPAAHTVDNLPSHQSGGGVRRERGLDGELERVMPYSGREPLRAIHWKLSARGDVLLVKEFGRQSAPPLIIDVERLSGSSLEERISRAAWLVRHMVRTRPVGLRLGGTVIPPDCGMGHGLILLKGLALYGLD